jgi:selenocysteine lyase/cysteine desulfurase
MELTRAFLDGLAPIGGLTVWGPRDLDRRVATVAVTLAGWSSSDLSAALEREAGILTRAGLHCAPLAHQTMGSLADGGTTRFSFGLYNTLAEVETAVATLRRLAKLKK